VDILKGKDFVVTIIRGKTTNEDESTGEVFLYQMEGESDVEGITSSPFHLRSKHVINFTPKEKKYTITTTDDALVMRLKWWSV